MSTFVPLDAVLGSAYVVAPSTCTLNEKFPALPRLFQTASQSSVPAPVTESMFVLAALTTDDRTTVYGATTVDGGGGSPRAPLPYGTFRVYGNPDAVSGFQRWPLTIAAMFGVTISASGIQLTPVNTPDTYVSVRTLRTLRVYSRSVCRRPLL